MSKESITEWWKAKGGPVGTLLLASVLVGGSIGFAARAEASPQTDAYAAQYGAAVCSTLDEYPTVAGLTGILTAVMEDGLSAYDSGVAVATAVWDQCPEYVPLLQRFIERYATKTPVYVAGAVGGRLP